MERGGDQRLRGEEQVNGRKARAVDSIGAPTLAKPCPHWERPLTGLSLFWVVCRLGNFTGANETTDKTMGRPNKVRFPKLEAALALNHEFKHHP